MAWLLAFSALAQDLTTADAVLDKYFAAVGGKEKLRTIQDMTTAATTDIQGRTLEMETKLKMPNKYKQVSYMMGNEAGELPTTAVPYRGRCAGSRLPSRGRKR